MSILTLSTLHLFPTAPIPPLLSPHPLPFPETSIPHSLRLLGHRRALIELHVEERPFEAYLRRAHFHKHHIQEDDPPPKYKSYCYSFSFWKRL